MSTRRPVPWTSTLVHESGQIQGGACCVKQAASYFLHRHPHVDRPRTRALVSASRREQGGKGGGPVSPEAGLSRALLTVAAADYPLGVETYQEKWEDDPDTAPDIWSSGPLQGPCHLLAFHSSPSFCLWGMWKDGIHPRRAQRGEDVS